MRNFQLVALDLYLLLILLAMGLMIGLFLLPWRKKMKGGGEISFLVAFTLFWPFLLIGFIWRGSKAYFRAWRRYLHARSSEALMNQKSAKQ